MIPTNEGSIRGACCFKCKWKNPQIPFKDLPLGPPGPNGEEHIAWDEVRMCDHNPDGMHYYGDVKQVCPMFELNKERWASLTVQRWEYEYRRRHPEWFGPLDCLI